MFLNNPKAWMPRINFTIALQGIGASLNGLKGLYEGLSGTIRKAFKAESTSLW